MRRGWFLLVLLAGCGGKSGAMPCAGAGTDLDGDAYGPGCPAGPDCDDMDPLHHDDCSACDTGPAPGCPCAVGAPSVSCFDGTAAQAGTPPCMKGLRACDPVSQTWGACAGQVAPAPEYCDTVDNDCDGVVDDGVLSMCGDCTPGCDQVVVGDGTPFPFPGDPLPPNVQSIDVDGVGLDPSGDLVLDAQNIEFHFLWVANAGEGTVSKLDTRTGREVARYASVAHAALVDVMGVGGADVPAWGGANSPSRTAVDFYGNVWVGNRAPYDAAYPAGLQPTATKIYNSTSDCVDRNGNGVIDTSNDASGDGRIDLADPAEFFAEADECIAFTVIVGARNDAVDEYGVRAVAIDRGIDPGEPGNAWVGLFSEQAFYQLSGRDGTLVRRVPATGNFQSEVGAPVSPYGAAIDGNGMLWTTNGCCGR